MSREEFEKQKFEPFFILLGLLSIFTSLIFILLLNFLVPGLLLFGMGVFFVALVGPKDPQSKKELKMTELDHAIALSRSIDPWEGGGIK